MDDGDEDHPPTMKKQWTNNNQENENDTKKTIELNNKNGAWGNDNRDQYNQTLRKKGAEEGTEEEATKTIHCVRSHTQSQQLTGERRIGEGRKRGEEEKEYSQQSREQ